MQPFPDERATEALPKGAALRTAITEGTLRKYSSRGCLKGHIPSDKNFKIYALRGLFGKIRHFRMKKKKKRLQ